MSKGDEIVHEEPQIFAVNQGNGKRTYTRRNFLELTAAASAALALNACTGGTPEPGVVSEAPTRPADTDTPVPTQTQEPSITASKKLTPEPKAVVIVASVNFQPELRYSPVGYLYQGDELDIICRTPDNKRLRVVSADGIEGWVAVSAVDINVPLESIPIETDITPTPAEVPVIPTGIPGEVKPGETGINYTVNGVPYTLPCGSPIPPGSVCVCNCVTVPSGCSCDNHTVTSHYWYPN